MDAAPMNPLSSRAAAPATGCAGYKHDRRRGETWGPTVVAFQLHVRPDLVSNRFDAGDAPEDNNAEPCRRCQEPQPPGIHTTDEGADASR